MAHVVDDAHKEGPRDEAKQEDKAVPAVALTAYAKAEDRVPALSGGYQVHLAKPVEPAELVLVVANLAGRDTISS